MGWKDNIIMSKNKEEFWDILTRPYELKYYSHAVFDGELTSVFMDPSTKEFWAKLNSKWEKCSDERPQ